MRLLGWAVLLIGAVILLAGAFANWRESRRRQDAHAEQYNRFLDFLAAVRSARHR
jgi:hypothetical protein